MDSPLIQPVCRGEALKQEMLNYAKESSRFHIWWLGQSGFLTARINVALFDPYLSDSLTRKYASTDKPHVRMTALAMDPSTLGFVQVVTSSHQHTDHLDADTLKPMIQANPDLQMVIPASMGAFAADRLEQPTDWFHGHDAGFSTVWVLFTHSCCSGGAGDWMWMTSGVIVISDMLSSSGHGRSIIVEIPWCMTGSIAC